MRETVGRCVRLNRQLQLSHDLFVDGNLQSYVADGYFVGEPAFDFGYPETTFLLLCKGFNLVDSQNDVVDVHENTLPSNHVTDLEHDFLLLTENLVDLSAVVLVFADKGFLYGRLRVFFDDFLLSKEHFFLDPNDGFCVGIVRVELEADLRLNRQVETSLSDELFKVTFVFLGDSGVLNDDALQLRLFVSVIL